MQTNDIDLHISHEVQVVWFIGYQRYWFGFVLKYFSGIQVPRIVSTVLS